MEKKKTTYRYAPQMERLIKKGIETFSQFTTTGTMTLSGLIDYCIQAAVETLPEQLARQTDQVWELQQQLKDEKEKNQELMQIIRQMHKLKKSQDNLESKIIQLLNQE